MIEELISKKSGQIDIDDMRKIQSDTIDIYAIKKKKALVNLFKSQVTQADEKEWLKKLEEWDGNFNKDLEVPTFFSMVEHQIFYDLFK